MSELLTIIARHWRLIVMIVVVFVTAGGGIAVTRAPLWEATAVLQAADHTGTQFRARAMARRLGHALTAGVEAPKVVRLTATATSAPAAREAVTAVIGALTAEQAAETSTLRAELRGLEVAPTSPAMPVPAIVGTVVVMQGLPAPPETIDRLARTQRVAQVITRLGQLDGDLRVLDPPDTPRNASPRTTHVLAAAGVVGLAVGLVAASLAEHFEQRG